MINEKEVNNSSFMNKAKAAVQQWYKESLNKDVPMESIYIVWFCKTLQNWKALLSTDIPDTRYFEVTYNGDKGELYLDAYLKESNMVIKDEVSK